MTIQLHSAVYTSICYYPTTMNTVQDNLQTPTRTPITSNDQRKT